MHLQELSSILFKTTNSDPNIRNLLADVTEKYPYFSAAHFFLLQNSDPGAENYNSLAAKTAIHFDNPFLLNFRMKQVEEIPQIHELEKIPVVEESKIEVIEEVAEIKPVESEPILSEIEVIETSPVLEESIVEIEKVAEIQEIVQETVESKEEPAVQAEHPKPFQNTEEMIFEPLFASDYFASQGIKLSEEVQAGDKLGKQLKSFTEWLKTMKKVHDSKLPGGNEQVDVAIQKLAEKSNQDAGILTESMAEAYQQQGKIKKAKEILEKLSLFNPSKSAYFAAKIESLAQDN